MPKTVELIGASGVGKTSVYKELQSKWEPGYNWVTYDKLKYDRTELLKRSVKSAQRLLLRLLPSSKSNQKKTDLPEKWKFIDKNSLTFRGEKYNEFKSVIMDLIQEHCIKGYEGTDKRFVTTYMMMWSLAHVDNVYSKKNDDRLCLLKEGEGLISRIMHLNTPSFDEEALNNFLELVPFPDYLILLESTPGLIMERIKNRNRISTLHKGMDEDTIAEYTTKTIKFFHIAMEKARRKGVNVYKVDATLSLEQTTGQVVDILSSR